MQSERGISWTSERTECEELLPCPFCGGEAMAVTQTVLGEPLAWVQCSYCGASAKPDAWANREPEWRGPEAHAAGMRDGEHEADTKWVAAIHAMTEGVLSGTRPDSPKRTDSFGRWLNEAIDKGDASEVHRCLRAVARQFPDSPPPAPPKPDKCTEVA